MSNKIDQSIIGFNVVKSSNSVEDVKQEAKTGISFIHEKLTRPEKLIGATYKVSTPESKHALYITMNDIILNEGTEFESRKPFEVFINTKNMKNYEWIVALTLLISAVFRKGGDVIFIVEELKSVFSPTGGYFKKGHGFMPSLVAEIGLVIEKHMRLIGLITAAEITEEDIEAKKAEMLEDKKLMKSSVVDAIAETQKDSQADGNDFPEGSVFCMSCSTNAMVMLDNCMTCLNCGESKCG